MYQSPNPLFRRSTFLLLTALLLAGVCHATTGYSIAEGMLYAVDLEGTDLLEIGPTGIEQPIALASDPAGALWAVDRFGPPHRLLQVNRATAEVTLVGEFDSDNSGGPSDLTFDSEGRLWLLRHDRLLELSTVDGSVLATVALDLPTEPSLLVYGLAAAPHGLYSMTPASFGPGTVIVRIDPNTGELTAVNDVTYSFGFIAGYLALDFDSDGALRSIQVIDPGLIAPPITTTYLGRLSAPLSGSFQLGPGRDGAPFLRGFAVAPGPFDRGVIDVPTLSGSLALLLTLLLALAAVRHLRTL